ncbi:hypothetical protein PHLGIDRAFT_104955 [Phlebiopsis gigantea 11061_1 CR5-6]|uniref:BTB domain-containing protein n=1 Tax=Phlebiopsis gigantea (strain 11061_1 CR5-6) TaxID=745531 RepID=A0A0C3SBK7_PHLG1|nr:hypothetical protein PHLGIDRAFT_104955 [Phlebiopsis gigantea 11061_1 CR5-6]
MHASSIAAHDKGCLWSPVFWTAGDSEPLPPDLTLVSSDYVLFHVHKHRLLLFSKNDFAGLLSSHADGSDNMSQPNQVMLVEVDEDSAVLAVVLSVVYDIPLGSLAPLEVVSPAIKSLEKYDISLQELAVPHRFLGEQLLSHALMRPMDVYVLAAEHQLEAIAAHTSSYLLAYPLARLSTEFAVRMGAQYLRRLYILQHARMTQLKFMLYGPLESHLATSQCGSEERKRIQRAWTVAVADLAWTAKGDMAPHTLQRAMLSIELDDAVTCTECKEAIRSRINAITKTWAIRENTI